MSYIVALHSAVCVVIKCFKNLGSWGTTSWGRPQRFCAWLWSSYQIQ